MTALSETNRYRINGVIDTAKPVIENIENIANSCQSWFTYDNTTGKWGVIMNREETSTYSFSDDNIVGSIRVGTNGIDKLYNSVETNYPDNDILDVNNTRSHTIPSNLQIAAEQPNLLKLAYSLLSDQTQAQNLSRSELWQSRTDISTSFTTNFIANEVAVGDVVDITNSTYGWTNKLFRVTNIREEDTTDGDIVYSIMANEYRDDIYNHVTVRDTEDPADGINTIANIGALGTVTFTKDEIADKPSITFNSTIPAAGSPVTAVQVWSYQITDPDELADWNDSVDYPDNQRKYNLLFTKQPSEEDYFTGSQTFSARTEDLGAGNYIFKLRPINATTQGQFTPIQLVNFAPQVAEGVVNTITNNTINFANIVSMLGNAEVVGFAGVTLSSTPHTVVAGINSILNDSRALIFSWDGQFYDPAGTPVNPRNATSFCELSIEVLKTRGSNPAVVLTNPWGRTTQFGFAVGNYATTAGQTFFLPGGSNDTFETGDVFSVRVKASVSGTNPAVHVLPTVKLDYFSL